MKGRKKSKKPTPVPGIKEEKSSIEQLNLQVKPPDTEGLLHIPLFNPKEGQLVRGLLVSGGSFDCGSSLQGTLQGQPQTREIISTPASVSSSNNTTPRTLLFHDHELAPGQ